MSAHYSKALASRNVSHGLQISSGRHQTLANAAVKCRYLEE